MTNSVSAIPILRSTHSIVSTLPVEMAKRGMLSPGSNSACLRGKRVCASVSTLLVHGVTLSVSTRRHLPSWMTTLTPGPVGGLVSVNLPSMPVVALTIDGCEVVHWSQRRAGGDRLNRTRRHVDDRVVDRVGIAEAGRRVGRSDDGAGDGRIAHVALRSAATADVVAADVGLHGAADVGRGAGAAAAGDQVAAAVARDAAVVRRAARTSSACTPARRRRWGRRRRRRTGRGRCRCRSSR